jgi:hypothetical protein
MGAMTLIRYIMRILVPAAAVVAMLTGTAAAQMGGPLMPKMSLQGDQKHLTPEEIEKRKQLDDAYKAATNKIPDQKADDPWADVRPAPSTPAPKKKQQ